MDRTNKTDTFPNVKATNVKETSVKETSVKEMIGRFLGAGVARYTQQLTPCEFENITEIRLRAHQPLLVKMHGKDYALGPHKVALAKDFPQCYCPTADDIYETMERISRHSFYAFEGELAMGYITLPGGHRVGVAGQAVVEGGVVRSWKYISAVNIRVTHSVPGCADGVLPRITQGGGLLHTMIISPPGCGKTTLLRDIVRQISNGGVTVGLADERSEVAACYQGIPQNDVGMRTDVLDGCPKPIAMDMLLRAMSPQVIAVDELGGGADAYAVDRALNAGVKLLCTAHGASVDDAMANPALAKMLGRGIFERFVVLGSGHQVVGVYAGDKRVL